MQDETGSLSRRQLLAGLAGVAATSLWPAGGGTVELGHRIDVHHHFLPQKYMAEEHERIVGVTHNLSGNALLKWTPQQALDEMDANGIRTAIASISTPGVWFGDVAAARRLSREWNDFAAETIRDHPGRFGLFAVVAPPDTEGALKEIDYALGSLKADGIGLLSNYDGKSLGDASFAPVLEELNRRKTIVYVHPTFSPCCANLIPGLIAQRIEFPLDTTRTITSLLFTGTLARLPDIRWIFSHGGGTVPYLEGRISEMDKDSKVAALNPKGTVYEMKKLYYDTASAVGKPTLAAMMAFIPPTHILFGSDYPFVKAKDGVEGLERYRFSEKMRTAIDSGNAMKLLPRLA
jgi:6-methylsalicylate decarboxylase